MQCRIGASTIFPKSEGYGLDLANLGLVVNPIWLLTIIWIVAFIGILQSIFFGNIHRILRASIYLIAGYMALPFMSVIFLSLSTSKIVLVITGGVIYSMGAIAYGFKFPKLNPDVFGFHEVFHTLVIIAAVLHFIVVYSLI